MSGISPASVARMRWPRPRCTSGATSSQIGLARERDQRRPSDASEPGYRVGISADRLAAVGELRGAPASRRSRAGPPALRSSILRQARERHPVVAAVDDRLEHRAETRVGVGDPVERLPVDRARATAAPRRTPAARSCLGLLAARRGPPRAATRSAAPATAPARRRSSATFVPANTVGADGLAADGVAVGLRHRERGRHRARPRPSAG